MTRRLLMLALLGLLVAGNLSLSATPRLSAAAPDDSAQLIDQLSRAAGGDLRVARHSRTGKLRFIGTSLAHPIAAKAGIGAGTPAEAAARIFLAEYGSLFGTTDQAHDLRASATSALPDGRSTVRFQQVYKNIPVLGGELRVQLNAARKLLATNGELQPDLRLGVTPTVGLDAARTTALAVIAKHSGRPLAELSASVPALWIYSSALLGGPGLGRPTLVWRLDVTAGAPTDMRELVLVDAQRGNVALHFDQLAYGKERYVCDRGNVVNSNDSCAVGPFARTETGPASAVADVNQAFVNAGLVYDFYFTKLGRDSLDGAGLPLRSTVRYCPDAAHCPYQNAYWNGTQMVYGNGFASADDVVGHELTHGVTDFTSSLFYYYQSGAINESLSDVFGELIDLTYDTATDDDSAGVRWKLGEDLAGIGAIRDMRDPTVFGDPDKMTSGNYTADLNEGDGGGVHQNSGVNNKAAYLMTDGATFNGRTVTGLGVDKVARIYYEAQTNLLLSASDYADLYQDLQQACQSLVGTAGITTADCAAVKDAVDATEMNLDPPAAEAPDAPICGAGLVPVNAFFDDFENPGLGRWTSATSLGPNGWYYPQNPNPYDQDLTYATSGQYNMWGDDPSEIVPNTAFDSNIRMTNGVQVPANAYLHFQHAFGFEDDPGFFYDGGVLEYSVNGSSTWTDAGPLFVDNGYNGTIYGGLDNPLGNRNAFGAESNGYISSRLNLSSLAGSSVRFRFRIGADSSVGDYGWFIDDLRIYTCADVAAFTEHVYLPFARK